MPTPTTYSAHLRVGTHVWDIASGDDADYGPLASLRHSWDARQDDGWPTQHDPTALVFGVVVEEGTDFSDVDQGTVVHFTFTPDGYATPLVNYGGTVRDLTAYPHERGMVYEITAIDHLVKLAEDYLTTGIITNALVPPGTLWAHLLALYAGTGTKRIKDNAALPDPFGGQSSKPATFPGSTGTWPAPWQITGSTWDVLRAVMSADTTRYDSTTGAPFTPLYQRGVLTYQLDANGDLLASRPFLGTWTQAGPINAPAELANVGGVWKRVGGNVDAGLVARQPTRWVRERVEPNVVTTRTSLGAGATFTRPHTGPDVVRDILRVFPYPLGTEGTEPQWVVSGLENPNQWGTLFTVQAARDPDVVNGWFTLPTAMQTHVRLHGIKPAWTPDGSGVQEGLLSGVALVIVPGGDWRVDFTLRRTMPDQANPSTGGWTTPGITWDQLDPTMTWDQLDPTLTWDQLSTIHP